MRVLISGAGVAGLTAAYWLRQFGIDTTIVERAKNLVTGGYKIDVRAAALGVLDRMGIGETIAAAATNMRGAELVDKTGAVISTMTGDEFGHRVGDDLEIVRGTLCQILRDQVPDVEILFDDTVQSIDNRPDTAHVTFASGAERDFDVVIGADGLHSRTRRLIFGEEDGFRRDLGMYLCVFSVPNYLGLDRMEMQYAEIGRIAALWATHDEDSAKACFGFAAPPGSVSLRDRAEQESAVRRVYADLGWEVPKLLEMMSQADDWYFDVAAQIEMDGWSAGRVALVGDAAYCASPMSGQGSSLALIGAYVLGGELGTAATSAEAFDRYDSSMRAFIRTNQALAVESARLMTENLGKGTVELSGSDVEATIARATKRITAASNAIELDDYVRR
ncbi:2-polyprenyl-6-methoxyphenol hydroxylase [Microbacterium sp. cf046]|uniref:FAD-dependent monooxygenase n=1 Tax=Microbacterium sp. cf046 TaxID=1761803 RepID=UPI0008EA3064|nr:FAD-dependent monooxygenase [Microbacterium sp. cf046]SFR93127.1 2-polyprenyl-6-methoxyphenol hydroxylase [Microbacterium sp. cf046]